MKNLLILFMTLAFMLKINAQSVELENASTKSSKVKALVIIYEVIHTKEPKDYEYNKAMILIYGSKIIKTCFTVNGVLSMVISDDRNENMYTVFPNLKTLILNERKVNRIAYKFVVTRTNNTKQILGLTCDEYKIINATLDDNTIMGFDYIYTFNKIKNYEQNYTEWRGPSGVLLEWNANDWGAFWKPVKWKASSISEQYVDSSLFNIPSDYSILTGEEYNLNCKGDKEYSKLVKAKHSININDAETVAKWTKLYETLSKNAPLNSLKIE